MPEKKTPRRARKDTIRRLYSRLASAFTIYVFYPLELIFFMSEQERLYTFRNWQHGDIVSASVLVRNGFYLNKEETEIVCVECGYKVKTHQLGQIDARQYHKKNSPNCGQIAIGNQYISQIAGLTNARHPANDRESDEEKGYHHTSQGRNNRTTAQQYNSSKSVYKPRHPRYNELSERIKSFENSEWPRDTVHQTPSELAAAGFFYTGKKDTVRCHYCDGGLRDWEPEDDPWIEHGRWFSFCKFVIRLKGMPFIQKCAIGNRNRPAIIETSVSKNLPKSSTNQDLKRTEEKRRNIEQHNPLETAAALIIKQMGYSNATVKSAIDTYKARTGKRDFDVTCLLEIIFEWEEQGHGLLEDTHTICVDGNGDSESENDLALTLQALVIENKVTETKCMNCKTRERTIMFLPCGHRLMCEECAKEQTRCCVCRKPIHTTVNIFLV